MNVEKLHIVLSRVVEDIKVNQIQENLQNSISMMQNIINQPNPSYQQSLSSYVANLYDGIEKSTYESLPPSYKQVLFEIAPRMLLGQQLRSKVKEVLSENQVTLQTAITELNKLVGEIANFVSNGTSLVQLLENFGFGAKDLGAGESEIGLLIPRTGIDSSFSQYQAQLKDFDLILNTFGEYVTGKKSDLKLKSLSSSDPLVYVGISIGVAAALGAAIDRIIRTYKGILEIRKLQAELEKVGVPEDKTAGIREHSNEVIGKAITDILAMIREEYCGIKDSARKNELESALGICLNKVANRIDEGYGFEIRVGSLPKPKSDETDNEQEKKKKQHEEVQRVEANLTFLNLEGSKILSLPEQRK